MAIAWLGTGACAPASPIGNREVGCGTVVLYDAQGERVQTIRYGRMPEHKKVTLQQQLEAEIARILALRPDLIRVRLADGAIHSAEVHWYEAAGIGRKEYKIKHLL